MGTQATRTRLGGQTRVHQIYFQIYNSIAMKQKPDVLHFRSTKCAESGNVATSRLALSLWKKTQEKPLGPGYQLAWTVKQITASNTRNWGVGHSPISPKRPCTTEQGRVLWLLSQSSLVKLRGCLFGLEPFEKVWRLAVTLLSTFVVLTIFFPKQKLISWC